MLRNLHYEQGESGLNFFLLYGWTILRAVETPLPDSKSNPIQSLGFYWVHRYPVGCDDFNFSSWILLASSQKVLVTKKNTLDFNGYGVGGLLYPPQTLPM